MRRYARYAVAWCVLLSIGIIPNVTHAGLLGTLKTAKSKTVAFLTHPQTCKWGFRLCFIAGRGFFDACTDAYQFAQIPPNDPHTRIINRSNFHVYKNARDILTLAAGTFMGIAVGKGYYTPGEAIREGVYTACITYPTWRGDYTYARWGDWWDTSAEHCQHLIPYPSWNLQDRYVRMSGNQVTAFYSFLYAAGIAGWILDD